MDCGRRFGKTKLAEVEIAGKAVAKNDARVAYIALTYQPARDILWRELLQTLGPVIVEKNESRLKITVRTVDGGRGYIVLRGWESIETLRGQHFDFLVLDEVAMYRNFWMHWQGGFAADPDRHARRDALSLDAEGLQPLLRPL